jgi:uncharacterized Zn finger protein
MAKEKKMPALEQMEMSLEEAKAYRASLHKPMPRVLNEEQKREAFRIFWTSNKAKYGKSKSLEKAIWLHLKTIGMNSPEKFADGLANFGLKKVK